MSNNSAETPENDTEETEETPEENDDPGTTADDDTPDDETPETGSESGGGFIAGAVAFVSAVLGLVSITGTSLTDKLHARTEILGQIDANTGTEVDQMEVYYGAPWGTVALINGGFAVLAVLVGIGVLLALYGRQSETQSWVKAFALGGVILGVIGVLIALGMNFDLFADQPEIPTPPPAGG